MCRLEFILIPPESDDPWYISGKKDEASSRSAKKKELMDPINEMERCLGAKRKCAKLSALPQVYFYNFFWW